MSGDDHSESCDNPRHAHWDEAERRKSPRMTDEEMKVLAAQVAKSTVEEVFKKMSLYTGRAILGKFWLLIVGLVGFLGWKFGIIKIP